MKTRIMLTTVMAILTLAWMAGSALAAGYNTVHLHPTDDACLDSFSPDSNFGSSLNTYVGDRASQAGGTCYSCYQFDMSAVPANAEILNAELWLCNHEKYGAPEQTATVDAHLITTPGWDENTVTWNARPGYTTAVSATVTGTFNPPGWGTWNVTADVAGDRPTRTRIGWLMKMSAPSQWVWLNFYTREQVPMPDYRPMLEITFSTVVADEPASWSKVKSLYR